MIRQPFVMTITLWALLASQPLRAQRSDLDGTSLEQSLALLSDGPTWDPPWADAMADTLEVLAGLEGPSPVGSQSLGSAHDGRLIQGVQLPEHPHYRVLSPQRAWGTATVVRWITEAFSLLESGSQVLVHDLSAPAGGPLRGHKSHQSGRDADIAYFQLGAAVSRLRPVSAQSLDATRQWALLQTWLKRRQAEFIFVDYELQPALFEGAQAQGATEAQLRQWFQFPRGPSHPGGIIRHAQGHADHLHVRFRCAAEDEGCTPTRTRRVRPAGHAAPATHSLYELMEDEGEDSGQGNSQLWELLQPQP